MTRTADRSLRALITGPAGSGKTHHALERVKEAATHPGRRGRSATRPGDVLLVLPTYAQAMHLTRVALARWDARAVLDDPFATFTSAGERYLDGFRVRALPSAVERDLLMAEALRQAGDGSFQRLAGRPGFRSRLLRLVKEIKQSGEEAETSRHRLASGLSVLPPDAGDRLASFLPVFEAYDQLLARAGLEDHEDTLRRLRDRLVEGRPASLPSLLVVDGFDDFTPVEQDILDALVDGVTGEGGEVLVTLPWDPARPALFAASRSAREHLLGRGFREQRVSVFLRQPRGTLARIAGTLFAEDPCPPPAPPDERIEAIVAGDPEDEAEAVARAARRLHAEPNLMRGWRDLGVVVRRLDEAGPRVLAALARLGIPARLVGTGEPLASEALVRAAMGPLQVLGGRTQAGAFDAARMLPWLRWRAALEESSASVTAADRLEIRWRREGWPQDFAQFSAALGGEQLDLQGLDVFAAQAASLAGWNALGPAIGRAVEALVPLPPAGGLDSQGRPLDGRADARRARASAARDRLLGILEELTRAAHRTGLGATVDRAETVVALSEAIESGRLLLPDRRLDVVNVLDFEEARFWELPVVVLMGLAQGEVPLHARDDILLDDEDREALRDRGGVVLPLARDREVRERRLFYGALTRASRRLVIVRSGVTEDGAPRGPSLYLRDLDRVVDLEEVTSRRPAGRPAPLRAECATPRDWALFAARTVRDPHVLPADRDLARALLEATEEDLFRRAARWKRHAADPIDLERFRSRFEGASRCVSAATVNHALACRYRLFLKRVVGVPEDDVPFAGPGFDARDRGTLVHEALRRALFDGEAGAEEIAAQTLAWAALRGGRACGALDLASHELERRELVRIVQLMRRREVENASRFTPQPDWLEFPFGDEAGVRLTEGEGALDLRGRIDRVDACERRAIIVDYKLSDASAESAWKASKEALDVQLPLYAALMQRLFGVEIVGLSWITARTRSRYGLWQSDVRELQEIDREGGRTERLEAEAFRALLRDGLHRAIQVVTAVRLGQHERQDEDAKRCGKCGWRTVCRPSFRLPAAADEIEGGTP